METNRYLPLFYFTLFLVMLTIGIMMSFPSAEFWAIWVWGLAFISNIYFYIRYKVEEYGIYKRRTVRD